MTGRATERVLAGIASCGPQERCNAVNPTDRTRIISPTLDRKIRRSLKRRMRLIALRIKLQLFLLDLRKFSIDLRYAALHIAGVVQRKALQFLRDRSHNFPRV